MKRVAVVFGTRPEAIKLAPVIEALDRSDHFSPLVIVSAQHREMLDGPLELFGIRPAHDLAVFRPGQSLTEVTARALEGLSGVMAEERPDYVLVQGDTTTTFAGGLAAFYHRVPVGHVEAGLRTGDRYAPYPEEVNRSLVGRLAETHFAATPWAKANLLAENVGDEAILVTGNTVIDALLAAVDRASRYATPELHELDRHDRPVLLVTAHRRESWGTPLAEIGRALADVATMNPNLLVVFPIHRNPLVREAIEPAVAALPNVQVCEPLPYGDFVRLMRRSTLILTDSGGIQEEGPSLGKPVLVMRDTTERPEAVKAGTAKLVGTDRAEIVYWVQRLLEDGVLYGQMANAANPYGDGRAAERIVAGLAHRLGLGRRPSDFVPSVP